jgi:hypothetical protein
MKKITLAGVALLVSVFSGAVLADMALTSKEQLEGKWKLQYTKSNITTKQMIKREDTWVMKNGQIVILNVPMGGKHFDQPAVTYSIEDGKLLVPYVGRGGGDKFSLVSVDDKNMVLKGTYGEHYYFDKVAE